MRAPLAAMNRGLRVLIHLGVDGSLPLLNGEIQHDGSGFGNDIQNSAITGTGAFLGNADS